jgi:hypothetical protein
VIAERLLSQIVIYHTVHSGDRPIMVEEGGKMGLRGMATCQHAHDANGINLLGCRLARELADLYEQIHTAYQ